MWWNSWKTNYNLHNDKVNNMSTYPLYNILFGPDGASLDPHTWQYTLFHVTDIKFEPTESEIEEMLTEERFDDFHEYCEELYYEILDSYKSDSELYDGPYKKPDPPNTIGEMLDVIFGSTYGKEDMMNYFYDKFGGQKAIKRQLAEVDITVGGFLGYILGEEKYNSHPDPEPDEDNEWAKDEDLVGEYVMQYLKEKIGISVDTLKIELVYK